MLYYSLYLFISLMLLIPSGVCLEPNLTLECSREVTVKEGGDAVLQCETLPAYNISRDLIELKHGSVLVHRRRKGEDDLDGQDPAFRNRTKLFPEDMGKGKFSLKLINVTEKDQGTYIVTFPKIGLKGNVSVIVVTEEKGTDEDHKGDSNNNDGITCPWWSWLVVVVVALLGLIVCFVSLIRCLNNKHNRRKAGNDADGKASAENQQDDPTEVFIPQAPQNDDTDGEEQQHNLQNGSAANPLLQGELDQ